ncbi:MAG: DUF1844 domain-containing protein [Candidatus Binatia bacterium]
MSEKDDPGFRVEDKRRFDPSGEPRESTQEDTVSPAEKRDGPDGQSDAGEETLAGSSEKTDLVFSGFVMSLASQAFVFLGTLPDPQTGKPNRDLTQATGIIDLLAALQTKTKGNLTDDEERMLEDILYQLRMQYVAELRSDGEKEAGE